VSAADVGLGGGAGQHEDADALELRREPLGRLEAIDSRHRDVHEDDLRPKTPREVERVGSLAAVPTTSIPSSRESTARRAAAKKAAVVDDEDTDRRERAHVPD
jgi:hypothetical protein